MTATLTKMDRRRRWEAKKLAERTCTDCGREPLRRAGSRLCETCHQKQVQRMRLRNAGTNFRS